MVPQVDANGNVTVFEFSEKEIKEVKVGMILRSRNVYKAKEVPGDIFWNSGILLVKVSDEGVTGLILNKKDDNQN